MWSRATLPSNTQCHTAECFVHFVAPDFSGAAFKFGTHELNFLLKACVCQLREHPGGKEEAAATERYLPNLSCILEHFLFVLLLLDVYHRQLPMLLFNVSLISISLLPHNISLNECIHRS